MFDNRFYVLFMALQVFLLLLTLSGAGELLSAPVLNAFLTLVLVVCFGLVNTDTVSGASKKVARSVSAVAIVVLPVVWVCWVFF